MYNYKIVSLLVICFGTVICLEKDVLCCGQGLLYGSNGTIKCWQPESKTVTPLSVSLPSGYREAMVFQNSKINLVVTETGQLVVVMKNRDVYYEPGMFCLGQSKPTLKMRTDHPVAVVFYEKPDKIIQDATYGYSMAVSAVFLLVTASFYAVRKEQRNLQGKSIINLCLSLGIGLGILAGMKLIPYSDMNLCAARGFFAYFFLVTSFFWTNVLSIQILKHTRLPNRSINEVEEGFSRYMLYAWGCPTVLTIAMAVINFMPGDHLKPGIGLDHCWFFDTAQQWQYMYSLLAMLMIVNVSIFIYTTTLLWRHWNSNDKCKDKLLLTIRLFIIMGVSWIFEMISSLTPHHWAFEVVDLLNSLQGVSIFVVLVLLPKLTYSPEVCDGTKYNLNITLEQPYAKMMSPSKKIDV